MNKIMPPVFCAIDTTDMDDAMGLAAAMQRAGCGIKIGLEFFNANGPRAVSEIKNFYEDLPVFLDLKYHDIPNTVAGAMRAIAPLGVDYVNVHAAGGLAMMQTARMALHEQADIVGLAPPKILAVTILTSMDEQSLEETGFRAGVEDRVIQLAELTKQAELDGVVCSAKEIAIIREKIGPAFILMVPGIRPEGSDSADQKRIMTPQQAMREGATHLVIGRPITQADNPEATACAILQSLEKQAA